MKLGIRWDEFGFVEQVKLIYKVSYVNMLNEKNIFMSSNWKTIKASNIWDKSTSARIRFLITKPVIMSLRKGDTKSYKQTCGILWTSHKKKEIQNEETYYN